MQDFGIAVKSFIIKNNQVLLLKRRDNDVHKPKEWDLPGGRLNFKEDPLKGVARETKEETNLDIEVVLPVDVHHFMRDDGQRITMIIFLCKALNDNIVLSEEHSEFCWKDLKSDKNQFPYWTHSALDNVITYKLNK